MIKASELRIGNLALGASRGEVITVTARIIDQIDRRLLVVGSIQLTEEWLVKFGFKNTQIGLFEMEVLNYGKINIHISKLRLLVELGTRGGYLFGNTKIQYVHQLQNLYFALTGTELECSAT